MEDYKAIMLDLINRFYTTNVNPRLIQLTTVEVYNLISGIIPMYPITNHDVYDIMKEAGFQIDQKIVVEKVCIKEATDLSAAEYDSVEKERLFVWNLYEKAPELEFI